LKSIHDRAYQELVYKLLEARKSKDISQEELAQLLDRHQTHVSKIERLDRTLDIMEYLRWCIALEIDAVEYFRELANKAELRRRGLRVRL